MKSDSKTTHFGVAFPKVSPSIYVCSHIEFKDSGGIHIQFFFTFKTTYVLAGCIKNNYTDVYSFDKDVLRLAKRPSFFLVNTVISFAMRFF